METEEFRYGAKDTRDLIDIPYEERKYIRIIRSDLPEGAKGVFQLADKLGSKNKLKVAGSLLGIIKHPTIYYAYRHQVYGVLFPGDGIPLYTNTYVCNPIDPRRYYPVDDFHKEMVNHKVMEAIYLLRSLGATEIEIVTSEETKKEFDFNLFFKKFTSTNHMNKNSTFKSQLSFSYEPSDIPPFIPEDVYWLDHEPQWEMIANQRLYHGLKSFNLEVEISNDFGVNSELVANLQSGKNAANANGGFNEFKKSSLILVGKFS